MSFAQRLLSILFPEKLVCLSCGREAAVNEEGFCAECAMGLEVFNSAPPLEGTDGFTAAYIYNDVSGRAVRRLKYNGRKFLAKPLSEKLSIPGEWHIDAVVPVPLHYKRERERGFNQSGLIARHLAQRLGTRFAPELLTRVKHTARQTDLTVAGRRRNVKDAFEADRACAGLSVLLIDDVRTTGSTLSACAEALKRKGCEKVYAAAVCFASGEGRKK